MRSERVRKAVVCLLLNLAFMTALAALPLRAGENVWTPIGPDGGTVTALAPHPTDPRIVWAGTMGGGVFKSTNGGRLWSAASQGLDSLFIRVLVVDPRSPDTLYARVVDADTNSEVYKSTDGGATWRRAGDGLPQVCCRFGQRVWLTLDPARPNVLYTGTSGGLYKSVDGGETWFWANRGLGNRGTTTLAVDPVSPDTLYVGAQRSIWKSIDGGATWFNSGTGMRDEVRAFAIDSRRTRTVYAATSEGLFKSTNAGASWLRLASAPSSVYTLAIDPLTPATLYAGTFTGVFKSSNGGRSWRRVGEGLPAGEVYVLEVAPSAPHILFGGGNLQQGSGVVKSADAGEHWQVFRRGLTASVVTSLAASKTAPAILYAGTDGQGVFRSDNGGAAWRAVNVGLGYLRVRGLVVDPTDPLTAYAVLKEDKGLFKTTGGGANWTPRHRDLTLFGTPGVGTATAFSLAVYPEDPSILLAGTIPGIYRSEDSAASWQLVKPHVSPMMVMEFAPSEPSVVYAAGYSWYVRHPGPPQLFKSTDAGLNWMERPYPQPGDRRIPTFAIDPRDAEVVYLWTVGALYRSADGGSNWTEVSRQDLHVTKLLFAPWNPEVMYALTDRGIYEITGGGSRWTPLNQGLKNSTVLDLIADPLSPGTLYAGTSGGGVYRLDRR